MSAEEGVGFVKANDEIGFDNGIGSDGWGPMLNLKACHVWKGLKTFLNDEYRRYTVYPPKAMIFRAFELCPYEDLKVVLVGQDPYPSADAMGLSFSSSNPKPPMSVKIIIKELLSESPHLRPRPTISIGAEGADLTSWAKQGILLLNRTLTVRKGEPLSHCGKGWEALTSSLVRKISKNKRGIVFILWGSKAQQMEEMIVGGRDHLIIKGAHPIPSRKKTLFLGSKPFTKINAFLEERSIKPIDFSIP